MSQDFVEPAGTAVVPGVGRGSLNFDDGADARRHQSPHHRRSADTLARCRSLRAVDVGDGVHSLGEDDPELLVQHLRAFADDVAVAAAQPASFSTETG
jgi:hypothetical protein